MMIVIESSVIDNTTDPTRLVTYGLSPDAYLA
jgi:hypothetical protein